MPTPVNAVWVDGFLVAYASQVLLGGADPPRFMSPYFNDVGFVPNVDFVTANPDTSVEVDVTALWAFALLGSHLAEVTASVTITFPPAAAGNIYWGVALYTASHVLAWFAPFGIPYVVPTGGTVLTILPQLHFGDCSSNP